MSEPFKTLLERRGSGSIKWDKTYIEKRFKVSDDTDIYPLFIADMDFEMDDSVKEKMLKSLQNPDFGYFSIQDSFYQSIIDWQKNIHHLDVHKEWILPSIGTVSSMNITCDLYGRNKAMMILTPVYAPFQGCCKVGNCVTLPLIETDLTYRIDFDEMRKIFAKQHIEILLFCNPHNPSGRVWTHAELQELVNLCKEYNVLLLADEIHSDILVGDVDFVSLFTFSDQYDRILITTSPNKTFSISGLSTSYLLCRNKSILADIKNYFNQLHLSCNRMGVMMCEYVYCYGHAWYEQLIEKIKENINLAYDYLDKTDMEYMKVDSGYLIWIKIKGVQDVDQFILDVAKHTHVLLETGSRFVENYEGWIRMNVATTTSYLEEALKRFVAFYQSIEK